MWCWSRWNMREATWSKRAETDLYVSLLVGESGIWNISIYTEVHLLEDESFSFLNTGWQLRKSQIPEDTFENLPITVFCTFLLFHGHHFPTSPQGMLSKTIKYSYNFHSIESLKPERGSNGYNELTWIGSLSGVSHFSSGSVRLSSWCRLTPRPH